MTECTLFHALWHYEACEPLVIVRVMEISIRKGKQDSHKVRRTPIEFWRVIPVMRSSSERGSTGSDVFFKIFE